MRARSPSAQASTIAEAVVTFRRSDLGRNRAFSRLIDAAVSGACAIALSRRAASLSVITLDTPSPQAVHGSLSPLT